MTLKRAVVWLICTRVTVIQYARGKGERATLSSILRPLRILTVWLATFSAVTSFSSEEKEKKALFEMDPPFVASFRLKDAYFVSSKKPKRGRR